MNISEFIDTYSDDLINIHEARAAAYTHPLRGDYAFAEWLDASFCRILVVFVIGGIEAMLESWRARDTTGVLENYFAKNISNSDRIKILCKVFSGFGIQVDEQIIDNYLAMKYLRNTIIHSGWKEYEKVWIEARGFPTDTRKLTKEHLNKIEHVNQNMMFYIALAGLANSNAPRPEKLAKLDEAITHRKDDTGILRIRDINRIIWNNLERIDSYICADIEKSALIKKYAWSGGRSNLELESLGYEECKRLFYLAARRAGEEDYELLARHRELAMEALEFWREYWQRAIAPHEMSIKSALEVFASHDFKPEISLWSVIANVKDDDAACRMVDQLLPNAVSLTSDQVVHALRTAKVAYEIIPNIMPVKLLTVSLPIVDPGNTPVYLREAERALDVFRLNRAWFECFERQRRFTGEELGFYVRMHLELSKYSNR